MGKWFSRSILLAIVSLALCGAAFSAEKVVVTYVKSPLNVPSIIEKEKGFFSAEFNKPVEYSNLTTGPEQTQALVAGDIQFLNAVGATSVFLAAANGADIRILSIYSRSPRAFILFGGKNSQIKSAADLKGKKVAGPKGTILHELLVAYLATAGLTEKDIKFLSMGIPGSQAALTAGEVDCALLAGPVAYNMRKAGFDIITNGEGLVEAIIVTAASGKTCSEKPEIVKAFLVGQAKTLSWIKQHSNEAAEMTMKETELPREAVDEMTPMYDFSQDIRDSDIMSMEKTVKFMVDNKMIDEPVDVKSLIFR